MISSLVIDAEKWANQQAKRFGLDDASTAHLERILVEAWRKGFHKGAKNTLWLMGEFVKDKNRKRLVSDAIVGPRTSDEELLGKEGV